MEPRQAAASGSARGLRRIDLFRYFPTFYTRRRRRLEPPHPFLPPALADDPDLHDDVTLVHDVLLPAFDRFDQRAKLEQNRHRRQQVLLILGGMLTTVFGAVQAALASQAWPGIVVAGVGAATAAVASVGRQSGALDAYLGNRLKAERLRSTAFAFLAGLHDVEHDTSADPECWLREQVTDISYEERATHR